MKYQIISESETELVLQMDDFVRSHGNCHFLQSPLWRQVKAQWRWYGILVWDNQYIVGAMSVLIRKLPLGMSILYAPRGPICDRNDHKIVKELLNGARELAKRYNGIHFCIDPDESADNEDFRRMMKGFSFIEKNDNDFGNIQPQFVFRLDTKNKTENEIFDNFSQKTRYNIRLAARRGVGISCYRGDQRIPDSAFNSFSQLMETTGKRDGFKVRNKEYFKRLLAAFGKDAVLFLANHNGTAIAGAIEILYGDTAWYLYGASANEYRNMMPNYLLQWEMICLALKRGCSVYDFRGVPGDVSESNPLYGLYRFKKGFGGEYTKFTGLFTYAYKPIMSQMFLKAIELYRLLNKK